MFIIQLACFNKIKLVFFFVCVCMRMCTPQCLYVWKEGSNHRCRPLTFTCLRQGLFVALCCVCQVPWPMNFGVPSLSASHLTVGARLQMWASIANRAGPGNVKSGPCTLPTRPPHQPKKEIMMAFMDYNIEAKEIIGMGFSSSSILGKCQDRCWKA